MEPLVVLNGVITYTLINGLINWVWGEINLLIGVTVFHSTDRIEVLNFGILKSCLRFLAYFWSNPESSK